MAALKNLLDYVEDQVGYTEDPKGSNRQKYGAYIDSTDWYLYKENGKTWRHLVNGYDWCTQFVDASFILSYGIEEARKLLHRPVYNNYGAVVKYAYGYFNSAGCGYKKEDYTPVPGDVIYFQNSAGLSHTGIVVAVNAAQVTTIEGNAGPGSNYVVKKTYDRKNNYIYGYGHVQYEASKYPATPFKATNTLKGVLVRDIPYSDGKGIATIKEGATITVEALEGSSGDFAKISGYVYLPGGFEWEGSKE